MSKNTIVRCDEVVGGRLLKFLDALDTISFIEAVDGSELFGSIAELPDHHFIRLIRTFTNYERIMLPHTLWDYCRNNSEIDEERLCIVPTRYSFFTQPSERLYIHACFGLEGFSKLCEAYRTSLFQCYCRLLPLNTAYYNADFGLLDYEWFSQTIGLKRALNGHEKNLFRGDKIVSTLPFLQALATQSFIVYTLYAESPKHLCTRIGKYCNRGFDLLLPIAFDGDLESMMKEEEIPLYRFEYKKYTNDEGEIYAATRECYRSFARNIDAFRLQEKFMFNISPKLLEYK
ncbi:unnamed protein product [Adineta ricciae]|uniref:Uncharacterized protein n=1 Tax=Adineta ricciae TaxID=249248 RepID=A0A815TYV8_ADIRI|nr:unnamed protein product [Adineta ricciae]CAF1509436.1 unnamed protein product [Adineta ricciae]